MASLIILALISSTFLWLDAEFVRVPANRSRGTLGARFAHLRGRGWWHKHWSGPYWSLKAQESKGTGWLAPGTWSARCSCLPWHSCTQQGFAAIHPRWSRELGWGCQLDFNDNRDDCENVNFELIKPIIRPSTSNLRRFCPNNLSLIITNIFCVLL